jgi:hypothetical protein
LEPQGDNDSDDEAEDDDSNLDNESLEEDNGDAEPIEVSSPTAQIHSIMMCLMVAACNPQYSRAKLDVKGAFKQTEISGAPEYIKCMGNYGIKY